MITFTNAQSKADLEGILALQHANLAQNVPAAELQSQGFVTITHTYEQLLNLNNHETHILAKEFNKVIGYLLSMTKHSKRDIPLLIPMFLAFDEILYNGKPIAASNYIIVGQACIAKAYRGTGILDKCYAVYKKQYSEKYEFAITEIAKSNARSLQAHKRIGFTEIKTYTSPDNTEWVIVLWDWHHSL